VAALVLARRARMYIGAPLLTSAAFAATIGGAAAEPRKAGDTVATRWQLGATPLPLRKDGFGLAFPTPPPLRDRRLPTIDRLPPPLSGGFEFTVRPAEHALQAGMPPVAADCPVGVSDLAYLALSFWGFDARPHTGELVVHRRVAQDIVRVFARLYASRFPIEEMRLTTAADIAAPPTGDGNNTAAFLCRGALGQQDRHRRWSSHAYGVAIDINPFQNPYRYGSLLLPELAFAYTDRKWRRPGMIQAGDVVTHSFADIGWAWGGTWTSRLDYMHFSETGE